MIISYNAIIRQVYRMRKRAAISKSAKEWQKTCNYCHSLWMTIAKYDYHANQRFLERLANLENSLWSQYTRLERAGELKD